MKHYQLYFILVVCSLVSCDFSNKQVNTVVVKPNTSVDSNQVSEQVSLQKVNVVNPDTSYLEQVFKNYDLIDVHLLDTTIRVNLKYASTDNFLKQNIYDGLRHAYLPCDVAIKLCNAQFFLKQLNPNYALVIFDAARPLHIQQLMWDSLDMVPNLKYAYLSPPYAISLHNYGCAVDISIMDVTTSNLLDMGSEFDFFGKLSQPIYEWQYLKTGELTKQAYENRKLLRRVMQQAKFYPITSEWWHFNYCNKAIAAAKFELIK